MKRRGIVLLPFAAALAATSLYAQAPRRTYRIGLLLSTSRSYMDSTRLMAGFHDEMRALGYVEGRNLVYEGRYAEGHTDALRGLAADLVRSRVDLIIAGNDQTALAAKQASADIPIVFAAAGDPIGIGLVKTLARPGGNVTGIASFSDVTIAKQLEILAEAFPKMKRVAVIHSSHAAASGKQLTAVQAAASNLRLQIRLHDVGSGDGMEAALAAVARDRPDALQVLVSVPTFLARERLAAFASSQKLPAVYGLGEHVSAGGLMSYSFNFSDNWRRVAGYVDKIIKGARPSDLPVEQPSKFELIVNMRTAKALGPTIQTSVIQRADRVIE